MKKKYIDVSQESGMRFIQRQIKGRFTMLNLLRFKEVADYSQCSELAGTEPNSGKEAYRIYMESVLPLLDTAGSTLIFQGEGGDFVIGPSDETWDYVLLVEHESVERFLSFAQDQNYLAIAGHRTAALADSRLLAIENIPLV